MAKFNTKIKKYPNGTQKYTTFSSPMFADENEPKAKRIDLTTSLYYDEIEDELMEVPNWDYLAYLAEKKKERFGNEDIRSDNIKRAKDKMFDIALLNSDVWDYMITFTLDKEKIDRYDSKEIGKAFKKWLNNMTVRKDLKYLLIPEYHRDGAIHFHGFINSGGLSFEPLGFNDKQGRPVFGIKEYKYGLNWAVRLDDNKYYVAKYITKYITKDTKKIMGNFIIAVVA